MPGACRTGQLFPRGHRARVARLPVGEPEGLMPNLLSRSHTTERVRLGGEMTDRTDGGRGDAGGTTSTPPCPACASHVVVPIPYGFPADDAF